MQYSLQDCKRFKRLTASVCWANVTAWKSAICFWWSFEDLNLFCLPPISIFPMDSVVAAGISMRPVLQVSVLVVAKLKAWWELTCDTNSAKWKGKSVPLQTWSGPEGSRKLRFPDIMTTAQDGDKVVSLTHWPLFTPRKYSWYSFLLEAESIPGP